MTNKMHHNTSFDAGFTQVLKDRKLNILSISQNVAFMSTAKYKHYNSSHL